MRYRPEQVVAVLDSRARGGDAERLADRRQRRRGARARADDGARRRRHAGRPLPAGLARAARRTASPPASTSRAACTSSSPTTPELAALAARARRRAARPAQAARRPERPDRREPDARREGRAHGRLRLRDREDDRRRSSSTRRRAARGIASEFVPTGQTGIAIAGWGISVDAVVADFIAGATEQLVLEGVARGGELLWVEGQGSLLHPAYSGVTLGLLHGSAPHALVLCHQAGQRFVDDDERFPMPSLARARRAARALVARSPGPAKVVAIALNTRRARRRTPPAPAIAAAEAETACRPTTRCASARRARQSVLETSVARTDSSLRGETPGRGPGGAQAHEKGCWLRSRACCAALALGSAAGRPSASASTTTSASTSRRAPWFYIRRCRPTGSG